MGCSATQQGKKNAGSAAFGQSSSNEAVDSRAGAKNATRGVLLIVIYLRQHPVGSGRPACC